MFCKHQWKLMNHMETKSAYETIVEVAWSPSRGGPWLFTKTIITDYQCEKCGKLKRFVTRVSP